jgi:hypothetical protein
MWIVKFLLRGHMEEIDTSLGRSLNSSESALGPRAESGGLPDSSRGEEDFAARRRKGLARPVRFPAGFLRMFPATNALREGLQVEVKLPEQPKPDKRVAQLASGH